MPKIRRWFHTSHDINADPEVWELTDLLGDRALRIWLEILSIADRNEGDIPGWSGEQFAEPSPQLRRSLAGRCRTTGETVRRASRFFDERSWTVPGMPHRVRNHAEYHRTREPNKIPQGNQLVSPPILPILPILPSEPKEEDIGISSCAEPSGFARVEQSQNGRRVKKKQPDLPPQALDLAEKLKDSILANVPGAIAPTPDEQRQWAGDIEKLSRINGKTWEQIEWLLSWSQHDPFWSQNIQSGAKFRKQWNQLLARASKEQPQYSAPITGNEPESSTMRWLREGKEAAAREQQARAEQQERKRQHGQ